MVLVVWELRLSAVVRERLRMRPQRMPVNELLLVLSLRVSPRPRWRIWGWRKRRIKGAGGGGRAGGRAGGRVRREEEEGVGDQGVHQAAGALGGDVTPLATVVEGLLVQRLLHHRPVDVQVELVGPAPLRNRVCSLF